MHSSLFTVGYLCGQCPEANLIGNSISSHRLVIERNYQNFHYFNVDFMFKSFKN